MMASFHLIEYLPLRASRQLRELYVSTALSRLGSSLVELFVSIYLYQLGYDIPAILLVYLATYAFHFFVVPLGGKFVLRFGHELSMVVGSLAAVVFFALLYGVPTYPWLIAPAVVVETLRRVFYWSGYHVAYADFGNDQEEGREISFRTTLEVLLAAAGPLLGGILLTASSFPVLFLVAAVLIVLSVVPLVVTKESVTVHHFGYGEAFSRFFDPAKQRFLAGTLGYGEEFIFLVLWPFFIYLYIVGTPLSLGSLVAGTTFFSVAMLFYIGRLVDRADKRAVLRAATIFSAFLWFIRPFVGGAGGVTLMDGLLRLNRRVREIPQYALIYERGRARHHSVRTIVLFEMGVAAAKSLAVVLCLVLFAFLPGPVAWGAVFAAAGVFSLFYLFL